MLTLQGDRQLRDLRLEFEEATLMADAFPNREDFQKLADSLELTIMNIESDHRYVQEDT